MRYLESTDVGRVKVDRRTPSSLRRLLRRRLVRPLREPLRLRFTAEEHEVILKSNRINNLITSLNVNSIVKFIIL